ncbi:MAG: hypothetical protein ACODAQ_03160, partial [Phycisphaeraceae bacterium]
MMPATVTVAAVLFFSASLHADETVLVSDGEARAALVVAADAHEKERTAAEELRTHIARMSGVELPVGEAPAEGLPVTIYIGGASPEPGTARIEADGTDPASFRLRVTGEAVHVTG